MGFMGGIFKALGFENEKKVKTKKKKVDASYSLTNERTKRIDQIDGVSVYYPQNLTQIKEFIEFVKDGKAIIVSKKVASKEDAQRIFDYVEGFINGINGKCVEIEQDSLYLILPEGMDVEE